MSLLEETGLDWYILLYPQGEAIYIKSEGIDRQDMLDELKDVVAHLKGPAPTDTVN